MAMEGQKRGGAATATAFDFERFVGALLRALGFPSVTEAGQLGVADRGADLQAVRDVRSPDGHPVRQSWAFEVKYRVASRVSTDELMPFLLMAQDPGIDKAVFVTSSKLTQSAQGYINDLDAPLVGKIEIWDQGTLAGLLDRLPDVRAAYRPLISDFYPEASAPDEPEETALVERLRACPVGREGWRGFERVGTDILTRCLVPPLKPPMPQAQTLRGRERRDALFPLRQVRDGWEDIRQEFDANFLLFEFKDLAEPFTPVEVDQTRNYLKHTIGRLGIVVSRHGPSDSALERRRSIYADEHKVILFFEDEHLIEMLNCKATNRTPLELIHRAIDEFYALY